MERGRIDVINWAMLRWTQNRKPVPSVRRIVTDSRPKHERMQRGIAHANMRMVPGRRMLPRK
jgi:hypothetical protein